MPSERRHILLVEEHRDTRVAFVALYENVHHYSLVVAETTRDAHGLARRQPVDLAVVDVATGPERRSRLHMIREWREDGLTFPVIATSASDHATLGIECLDAGADDFLRKPFRFAELTARIQRQLRRCASPAIGASVARIDGIRLPSAPFEFAGATIHPDLRMTFSNGFTQILKPKHVGILKHFAENAGGLVLRDKLITVVWGPDANTHSDSVHQYLHTLRRYFRAAGVDLNSYVRAAPKAGWRIAGNAVGTRTG